MGALAVGFTVAYIFHQRLILWLEGPLPEAKRHPITLAIAEPFMTSVKVSLAAGFALALPVILWQLWSYLAPAFRQGIQRTVATFVTIASVLFVGGVAFGYAVALPAALKFLTSYDSELYNIQIRAQAYYSFALMVLVAVGVVFELPVFIIALVRLGVTSSRKLRRNRRIGYVIVAALAVALPGVDPVTTAFEMLPLMALFEASIWASVLLERRWERAHTARLVMTEA
jgi:sec-independent protein translocase protein TatC